MSFNLLQEDIETYILFSVAPVYFILLSIIQTRYLKSLKLIENKYIKKEVKNEAIQNIKRLKKRTPFIVLIGLFFHTLIYSVLMYSAIRWSYFISIGIVYLAFLFLMMLNFKLKGASILKGTGSFGGLPG